MLICQYETCNIHFFHGHGFLTVFLTVRKAVRKNDTAKSVVKKNSHGEKFFFLSYMLSSFDIFSR